jgi:hypothetical protein
MELVELRGSNMTAPYSGATLIEKVYVCTMAAISPIVPQFDVIMDHISNHETLDKVFKSSNSSSGTINQYTLSRDGRETQGK